MNKTIWDDVRVEVEDLQIMIKNFKLLVSDIDHRMMKIAEDNAIEAGFADFIIF